jgi:hypothetical protein
VGGSVTAADSSTATTMGMTSLAADTFTTKLTSKSVTASIHTEQYDTTRVHSVTTPAGHAYEPCLSGAAASSTVSTSYYVRSL